MRIQLDREVSPPSASRPAEKPPPKCMGAQTKDALAYRSEYRTLKPKTGEPGEMSSNYLVFSVLFCPSPAHSPQKRHSDWALSLRRGQEMGLGLR